MRMKQLDEVSDCQSPIAPDRSKHRNRVVERDVERCVVRRAFDNQCIPLFVDEMVGYSEPGDAGGVRVFRDIVLDSARARPKLSVRRRRNKRINLQIDEHPSRNNRAGGVAVVRIREIHYHERGRVLVEGG